MDPTTDIQGTIQKLAAGAATDVKQDPGPGDVGPSLETKTGQLVSLPMTEDEVGEWWKRIERATNRRTTREEKWEILLREYLPNVKKSGQAEDIKVPKHFRNVHTKIGSLFYRCPDLVLTPREMSPAQNQMPNPAAAMTPPGMPPPPPLTMEDIIAVKQSVLQEKLGMDEIDAEALMDALLFDVMAWAGIGACKIGYRCVIKDVPQPKMMPGPPPQGSTLGLQQAPMVPALGPDDQPIMEQVPVPIFEEWYMRRFSPKKLLFNDDLHSGFYDKDATWIGYDGYMSSSRAQKPPEQGGLGLSEDEANKACEDDRLFVYDEDKQQSTTGLGLVHYVEIFCKANYFTDEIHPLAINQLVLVEGIRDRPIVWRPSPDQTFDELGKLTPDSVLGFPIQVLAIRDLADSPYPEADSAFTCAEVKELNTYRRQSIKIRDAAIGKYLYDKGAFSDDGDIEKLQNGETGEYIGVEDGRLANGADKVFTTTAQVHSTPDDYHGVELLNRDIDETLGISAVQAGSPERTVRTATEIAQVQSAVSARNDKELSRVVKFYLRCVRILDQLLMRYASQNQYIQITGDDGARRMMVWNRAVIAGKYLYEIAPDSQQRVDTAKDFQQDAALYNIAAKDPLLNRAYLLKRMARRRGYDPNKLVLNPMAAMSQLPHQGQSAGSAGPSHPQQAGQSAGPARGQGPVDSHAASNSGGRSNEPGAANMRDLMSAAVPKSGKPM